jgi:hypothetical protein
MDRQDGRSLLRTATHNLFANEPWLTITVELPHKVPGIAGHCLPLPQEEAAQ